MTIDQQTSLLKFVKARDQLGNGRLPCAGMTHKGKSFTGLDEQVEVRQDRFVLNILKMNIIEVNVPFKRTYILFIDLNNIWIGIDQGEGALRSRESRLDLCPERGEVENWKKELVKADNEEIPCADGDSPLCGTQPTEIDQDRGKDSAERIERREDE